MVVTILSVDNNAGMARVRVSKMEILACLDIWHVDRLQGGARDSKNGQMSVRRMNYVAALILILAQIGRILVATRFGLPQILMVCVTMLSVSIKGCSFVIMLEVRKGARKTISNLQTCIDIFILVTLIFGPLYCLINKSQGSYA